jgi:hypothetical protein
LLPSYSAVTAPWKTTPIAARRHSRLSLRHEPPRHEQKMAHRYADLAK